MKKLIFTAATIFSLVAFWGFTNMIEQPEPVALKWYTWEEAIELNKTNPKKIMVDMYTSWCGWCKVMDQETFTDPEIINYINKYYYPVKFDAEQKENLVFNDHTFKFIAQGRRGVHEFAYSLLDGQLSYPSIVYLNEKVQRITISPGYKKPEQLIQELKFVAEEAFTKQSFQDFVKENF